MSCRIPSTKLCSTTETSDQVFSSTPHLFPLHCYSDIGLLCFAVKVTTSISIYLPRFQIFALLPSYVNLGKQQMAILKVHLWQTKSYNFLVITVEFSKYLWSLFLIFGFNCLNLVINSALLLIMFHSHRTCPSMSCYALCCQIPCMKSSPQGFYPQSQLTFNNSSISSIHDVGCIGYGFIVQMIKRKHCKIFDLPLNQPHNWSGNDETQIVVNCWHGASSLF